MAEFLTMQEAEDKFGKKGRTNAALTLGIIGTALGAFAGNNGCGCGNNGILGGLFGGNNGNCIAEKAMQTAMAQGQMSQNLASPATSETITTLVPEVNKVIDVIIPNGVSIVNQAILDELPTSLPVKGNCAYSVFEIQIPAAA